MATLETYISQFGTLHVNITKGKKAPHKAILLLSIIEMFEKGKILTPEIFYDSELEETFAEMWEKFASHIEGFSPFAGTPFWHMNYEPFWTLIPRNAYANDKDIFSNKTPGSYSKTIKEFVRCARIDDDLFTVLQDKENRQQLKKTLIDYYLI